MAKQSNPSQGAHSLMQIIMDKVETISRNALRFKQDQRGR